MERHTPDETAENRDDLLEERAPVRTRRARRSHRRILGPWARLGLLGLACCVLLAAAFAIVAKVIRPYQQGRELREQVDVLRTQLAAKQAENVEYESKLAYLKTPEGVATEARKLGYVRPGEIPVVVTNSTQSDDASLSAVQASPPADRSQGFWRAIIGGR
jgi:cell division protein FtsB